VVPQKRVTYRRGRLFEKGLVSWVESTEHRRVRNVALTPGGKDLIAPAFRKHSAQMRKVFSELSADGLRCLEMALKKIGRGLEPPHPYVYCTKHARRSIPVTAANIDSF